MKKSKIRYRWFLVIVGIIVFAGINELVFGEDCCKNQEIRSLPTQISSQDNPILIPDKVTTNWISEPYIIKHQGKYLMVVEVQLRDKDLSEKKSYPLTNYDSVPFQELNDNFVIGFAWSKDGVIFSEILYPKVNAPDPRYCAEGAIVPEKIRNNYLYHLWFVTTGNSRILYTKSKSLTEFSLEPQLINLFKTDEKGDKNKFPDITPIRNIELPFILNEKANKFVMYFGINQEGIYRAVSEDGLNFIFQPDFPVIARGIQGEWDTDIVWDPVVTKYKGYYIMFYSGSKTAYNPVLKLNAYNFRIGAAVSQDGITWKKVFSNPLVFPGGWADVSVGEPGVICLKDSIFRLYFTGYSSKYNRAVGAILIDVKDLIRDYKRIYMKNKKDKIMLN